MRKLYQHTAAFVACGLIVLSVNALSQSTTITYNPANPGLSSPIPENTLPAHPGNEFDKTSLTNIPQSFNQVTVDGVINAAEWSDALLLNLPTVVTAGNRAWVKVDACYMYIAVEIHCNPSYYGNANMANIWFDVNGDGTWDGIDDPVLGLPAPGFLYPPNVASYGYIGLGNWSLYWPYTDRLRCHIPWYSLGVVPPESHVMVRKTDAPPGLTYVEARMDYVNGPIKLTGNQNFGMRIQTYSGYYTGGGTIQIQSQWPTVNGSIYFYGTWATDLASTVIPVVLAAGNFFDVSATRVADNPVFGSKAYVTGTSITAEIDYTLNDPPPQTIDYRARFYGPYPSTSLYYTYTGQVTVNSMAGTAQVSIPVNVPIGFYTVEVEADDPEVCGIEPRMDINNILILGPGQTPCSVFPGDVNDDGIVNYGDKKDLWDYIRDANLNPNWLQGWYRLAPNYPKPLAEIEFIGQAAIPWNTPEGCFMDTDGSGFVNTLDYVAIKTNWYNVNNGSPKNDFQFNTASFDLGQNYPNPFNPSTKLDFSAPERSSVSLIVTDVLGKTVATLASGTFAAGVHTVTFDAKHMASGKYLATIRMTGEESGLTFNKSVSMTLMK